MAQASPVSQLCSALLACFGTMTTDGHSSEVAHARYTSSSQRSVARRRAQASAAGLLAAAYQRVHDLEEQLAVFEALLGPSSASSDLVNRLAALAPCLLAQASAAATGLNAHSSRGLVSTDTHVLASAAKHNFGRPFQDITPSVARRDQRGTKPCGSSNSPGSALGCGPEQLAARDSAVLEVRSGGRTYSIAEPSEQECCAISGAVPPPPPTFSGDVACAHDIFCIDQSILAIVTPPSCHARTDCSSFDLQQLFLPCVGPPTTEVGPGDNDDLDMLRLQAAPSTTLPSGPLAFEPVLQFSKYFVVVQPLSELLDAQSDSIALLCARLDSFNVDAPDWLPSAYGRDPGDADVSCSEDAVPPSCDGLHYCFSGFGVEAFGDEADEQTPRDKSCAVVPLYDSDYVDCDGDAFAFIDVGNFVALKQASRFSFHLVLDIFNLLIGEIFPPRSGEGDGYPLRPVAPERLCYGYLPPTPRDDVLHVHAPACIQAHMKRYSFKSTTRTSSDVPPPSQGAMLASSALFTSQTAAPSAYATDQAGECKQQ